MKKNIFLEILKILGAIIAGGFLWLIIFSFALPAAEDGSTSEPFPGAIIVLGIITAVIVLLIINYNTMQKARQRTLSSFSNIKVFDERTDRLLTKANKVADKYMSHEESVQVGVAEKRTRQSRVIRNAEQFQVELEHYPELKANESIMNLLEQIRESENAFAQSKLQYNADVENYNTMIHTFPNNLFSKICRFKDAEFYDESKDNEVSDEELGI